MTRTRDSHGRLAASRTSNEAGEWPCSTCKEHKPVSSFSWDAGRGQPKRICKVCHAEAEKARRAVPANRDYMRVWLLKKNYGITAEEYHALYDSQEGRCAVCQDEVPNLLKYDGDGRRVVALDHCHDSGRIRGILCRDCNVGLGTFRDDPNRLRSAIEYLTREN